MLFFSHKNFSFSKNSLFFVSYLKINEYFTCWYTLNKNILGSWQFVLNFKKKKRTRPSFFIFVYMKILKLNYLNTYQPPMLNYMLQEFIARRRDV